MKAVRIFYVVSNLLFSVWATTKTSTTIPANSQHETTTKIRAYFEALKTHSLPLLSGSNLESFQRESLHTDSQKQLLATNLNAVKDGVEGIFIYGINNWMTSNNPQSQSLVKPLSEISYYLGYELKFRSIINRAISRIAYENRSDINNEFGLTNTLILFYVTCDVDHITGGDEKRIKDVKLAFQELLKSYNENIEPLPDSSKETFAKTVIDNLQVFGDVHSAFNVSISLMKNMQYLGESGDDDFIKLKNIVVPGKNQLLRLFVLDNLILTDVKQIEKNHLDVLKLVATEVFGYVHNHFSILIELVDFDIDQDDFKEILRFSVITYAFIDIFLARIIEFQRGFISKEATENKENMAGSMCLLFDFINPKMLGYKLSKEELDYTIENYNNATVRANEAFKNLMLKIIQTATNSLMCYCGRNVREWEENRVLKCPEVQSYSKNQLITFMKNNTNNAFKTLNTLHEYNVAEFENTTTDSTNFLELLLEQTDNITI